jgi:sterol desaturase/sphingolipid hydroxylase (fatty acid hydroxylase superfamily)
VTGAVAGWIAHLQTAFYEGAVQPVLYALDLVEYAEPAYEATEWFLYGLIEIAVLYALLRPLEARFPAEVWGDRRLVKSDVVYTLLNRLGLVPLAFFFLLTPVLDAAEGALKLHGYRPYNLEDLLPVLAQAPLAAFFLYLVVLDFAEYWRHRLQHRFEWWWALHSLHHSQRQMSFWTDNRNHLLDDLAGSLWFAALALAIGVPPGQFLLIVIATRMLESLQHANLRLSFGPVGEWLLVSPRFHRLHHAIGDGHEGRYRGCNFAVLFPVWDVLFRTADFGERFRPTGVRDQLAGRDYGEGFWAQQWLGLKRFRAALTPAGSRGAVRAPKRKTRLAPGFKDKFPGSRGRFRI